MKKIISIVTCLALICGMFCFGTAVSAQAESYSIDFSRYSIVAGAYNTAGSVRQDKGTFSIEEDATARGGKVLQYVRNSAESTAPSHFAFMMNPEGGTDASKYIQLTPGKDYTFTIRYKAWDIPADKYFQIRIWTSTSAKMGVQDQSTCTLVIGHKNSTDGWVTESATITAPAAGYLQGALIVHNTSAGNQGNWMQNNTGWSAMIDYIDIVGESEEEEEPEQPEIDEELAAEYQESAAEKINFDSYTVKTAAGSNNVRSDLGTFNVNSGVADTTDGYTLSYTRNSDVSNANRNNHALYMFALNGTGATNKDGALKLAPGGDYKMKIRYRIQNDAANAASQVWQFRFCTTTNNQYTPNNRNDAGADGNRVKAFDRTGNTDGFVTETRYFTAPGYAADANVSLIMSVVPTTNTVHDGSNNVSGSIAGWSWDIDYIYFEQVNFDHMGFRDYVINANGSSGNVRTDAGSFSVKADADTEDGYALHYSRYNSTGNANPAVYMFALNYTGAIDSAGRYTLTTGKTYNVTMRYKISGGADDQMWQFRMYHTTNYNYAPFSRANDADATKIVRAFQQTGNTDGYVTASFLVTGPAHADFCNLIGCLVPVTTTTVSNYGVYTGGGWSWDIDYIHFDDADTEMNGEYCNIARDLKLGYQVNATGDKVRFITTVDEAYVDDIDAITLTVNGVTYACHDAYTGLLANGNTVTQDGKLFVTLTVDKAAKYNISVNAVLKDQSVYGAVKTLSF